MAQEQLGALTIGGGSARLSGGGGGSQISLPSRPKCTNRNENGANSAGIPALIDLKIAENAVFFILKYLTKYLPETFFEEYMNFKIFCYLRHCGVTVYLLKVLDVIYAPSHLD